MEKCYLLHIHLGGKPSKPRIAEAGRDIKRIVDALSPDNQLAYTSSDGGTFAFFLKSPLTAGQIAHRVNSPGGEPPHLVPAPIRTGDSALVLEIGGDVSGIGNSRVQGWFQFHAPATNPASKGQAASGGGLGQSQLAEQLAKIKAERGKL